MLVVGKPNIADRKKFEQRLAKILDNRILTNEGPFARELEEKFGEYVGAHAVVVANGTIALEMVLRALGLNSRSRVGLPSFTFVATAAAPFGLGCDIEFIDCGMSGGLVEPIRIGTKLDALILCNLFGGTCDMPYWTNWAHENNVRLIFDSAHGLGAEAVPCSGLSSKRLGSFGEAEIFSLHATKIVQGFEGGVITTKDLDLAHRLRLMRNFGYDTSGPRHNVPNAWGYNAKLSEVHAAMALTNLERIDDIISHNREVFDAYDAVLPGWFYEPDLVLGKSNYSYVAIQVDEKKRDRILDTLFDNGVFARKYFDPPCHKIFPYGLKYHPKMGTTELVASRMICLPTGLNITKEDATKIGGIVEKEMRL